MNEIIFEKRWKDLMTSLSAPEDNSDLIFKDLIDHYQSPKRFYHNLTHIHQLLESAETYKNEITNFKVVSLAIWFHDVIYNTLRSDNEEKSALYGKEAMKKLEISDDIILKVSQMILATKNHMQLPNDFDSDTQFFLDFDLKVLGSNLEDYKIYMKQIRLEYKHVPDFLYNPGRKKVLKSFLEAKHIYRTEEFRRKYEQRAKENLEYEVSHL